MARNRQAHEGPDFEPAPATKMAPADPAVSRKSLQSELLRLQGAGGNQMVVRMMEAANNALSDDLEVSAEDGVEERVKRFNEEELLKPLERWFFGHSP